MTRTRTHPRLDGVASHVKRLPFCRIGKAHAGPTLAMPGAISVLKESPMRSLSIRRSTILLGGSLVTAMACANPFASETERLEAHVSPPVLVLDNHGPATIYTLVVERNTLALINYAVCLDPEK